MSPQYLKRLAVGALLGAFGLQAQVTIPAEFAYPLSAAAAAKAAAENPADALALAESIKNREDISAADREAALKAQQDALKKLAEAAATGDAKAKEAIDKYRASK